MLLASPATMAARSVARFAGRPAIAGLLVAIAMLAAPIVSAPLNRLSSPFALLIVLPPLALALDAYGWSAQLAAPLRRLDPARVRLLGTYAVWLATSALLTLDVAAVAAASVGIGVAGRRADERRWQLGSAILGANVGSLLLPFSNLTNLVLVAASGVGLATYVRLAIGPQLAAAVAVGMLLTSRGSASLELGDASAGPGAKGLTPTAAVSTVGQISHATKLAAVVALGGAAAAVAFGLMGLNMAIPFAASAAVLTGSAVASSRLRLGSLLAAIPWAGLGIVAIAALSAGLLGAAAGAVPMPDGGLGGLLLALAMGGLLAAVINNLPAAAFGAAWLARAHPAAIVAYLIGTNLIAIATPHGSVATLLVRAKGARHGVMTPAAVHLATAWRYAAVGAIAGFAALLVVAH